MLICHYVNAAHDSIFGILTFSTSTYIPLNIYWLSLLLAGCLEIGWPLGLKLADLPNMKI